MTKMIVKKLLRAVTSVSLLRNVLLFLTRRGYLPRFIWIRLPVAGTYSVTPIDGCEFKYSFVPGDIVGNNLFWNGTFETGTATVFFDLAQGARGVLDIGANTGFYTLLTCAANPTARITALEPVPGIRRVLEKNVSINNWQTRCSILPYAASNCSGEAEFSVLRGEIPVSSSLDPKGFRGKKVSQLIRVPTTTIDELCEELDDIDLVKVDVEGFEDQVLEGMTRVLTSLRPSLIIECNHDGPYEKVEQLLRSHGYSYFYRIEDGGPISVPSIEPDQNDVDRNYLCTFLPVN